MSPQTLKMLVMFLLAAFLLNMTNYLFYWLYDPPSRQAMKVEVAVLEQTKVIPKRRVTRIPKWANFIICEDKNSSSLQAEGQISGSTEYDYRDHDVHGSHDANAFYYYNVKKGEKMCPETPPGLGPLKADTMSSPSEIEKFFDLLQPGGIYEETECIPRQSVAIILNYREGGENQLMEFVYSMHSFLMKQQLEYQIFLVKQTNTTTPRYPGKLLNVGYIEASGMKKSGEWNCLVFHEQLLVPVDSRNLYRCTDHPQQLVTRLGNRSYERAFGGAIAVKPEQFLKVNGFSNSYVSENDASFEDLYRRLIQANYTTMNNGTFGNYERVKYSADETYEFKQYKTMSTSSPLNLIDGLSTISYTLKLIDMKPMYTLIDVDVDKPQMNASSLWERLFNQQATTTTSKHL